MSLEKYKQKRNFKDTPEPAGKVKKKADKLTFVIQRHHASHLHYDFRLELNGTLKSWAVPKGPSLNPKDKRLAMMVEDHPLDYASFEGDIPAGNYGAGHVDIWDQGTYEPVDENGKVITVSAFNKNLYDGSIKFRMKGRKLKGEFALVNLKKDEKSWLLIKHRDEHAIDDEYTAEDYAKKSSLAYTAARNAGTISISAKAPAKKAATKKAVKKTATKKVAAKKTAAVKKKAQPEEEVKPSYQPTFRSSPSKYTDFIKPMLAKLHDGAFDREGWIFEIKWDGYRAVAEIDVKNSRLYSRNGLAFEKEYEVVFDELKRIKKKMVLDGEIVAFGEDGMPSFQAIQQYAPTTTPLVYYVFDILYYNGKSLKDSPLLERKQILKDLLPESDIIKYCDHIETKGKDFFELMQKQGLEGMIAKRGDSTYAEGSRTNDWLKIKHMLTDEAVIAGYTAPRGGRNYFGALILGSYENGKLKYIGHTGTGFNHKTLKEVHAKLQKLETNKSPFEEKVKVNSPVTWVKPVLVCNLKFTEVTADGNRRHPVFMGLRKDKAAKEVKLEAPVETETKEPLTVEDTTMDKTTTISGKKLLLTNQDKIYWPDKGYTKGDVIEYYSKMAKHMMKYLKGRPQSLMRTPNGIKGGAFYHKDAGENAPEWMETFPVWSDSANKTIDYLICNDKPSLLYIANLGCIEINPWNSTTKNPDNPDYFVMDIDPSDKNTFEQVIDCALVIKEILDKAGADSYCKTSGSTGLHIYVPLGAKYTYDEAKQFAEMIAQLTQEQLPDFTTLERSLSKRGKDQIYIDYLQNRRGQTLSSVYSLRPKPGAPVSTPLEWKEVKKGLQTLDFTIENIFKRLEKKGDLFAPVLGKGIDMLKAVKKLLEK